MHTVISFPANACSALATMGLDHTFHTLDPNNQEKWFIGASMGAVRSIAILQSNITKQNYTDKLANFIIHLTYKPGDTPATLSNYLTTFYDTLIPPSSIPHLLSHPSLHLGIMVTRLRSPYDKLPPWVISIIILLYLLLGICTPFHLTHALFDSLCYYSGNTPPPIQARPNLPPIHFYPLTNENLKLILQASSAVPFLTKPVITPQGYLLDGGLTNYMCNFQTLPPYNCLIVADNPRYNFPHYLDGTSFFPRHIHTTSPPNLYSLPVPVPKLTEWFYPAYIRNPQKRIQRWKDIYQASLIAAAAPSPVKYNPPPMAP